MTDGRKVHPARLERGLAGLGSFCWRHAVLVILGWMVVTAGIAVLAGGASTRLLSGSGEIGGSVSQRVDETMRTDFAGNGAQSLLLVFRSVRLDARPAELAALVDGLRQRLTALPLVERATAEQDFAEGRLLPAPGSGHLFVVDLTTRDVLASEQAVPALREAVAPLFATAGQRHGDLEWAITGRAALTYDLNRFSTEDTGRSELRTLPLTVAVLLVAFGSIVGMLLPLLLALVARTIALGIVFLLAASVDVSNVVQSIVTMLAIALGIDYSLFLVHRYRRALAEAGAERPHILAVRERALRRAMRQSGTAILYSSATVAIGLGALLLTPLMQSRSIGLGGLFAVIVTLLASLTLVPALLRLLGGRPLDWPSALSGRLSGDRSRRLWDRWARLIMLRPVSVIAVSLALLLLLAAPALQTRFGFPEGEFLPTELEYSRGLQLLDGMQLKGLVSPVYVVVSDVGGGEALTPDRQPLLEEFVARLERDARVRAVFGPVESAAASADSAGTMEVAVGRALARRAHVSEDGRRLLFRIIPAGDSTLAALRSLSVSLPGQLRIAGLRTEVGGQAQYYNDFDTSVAASLPITVGLVLAMSALVLLLIFRAPLATAKAIVLNLLSVAAGYGVVVLVFQLGYGATWFGLPGATTVVPITVPLVIFCILFGLSMDYEIFLLSRVRSIFLETGDNAGSIREGLADTGSVITSAALVMVAVFGAFAFARIFIIQMIGLGLAVAVLVDATIIRSALGPALMQVAGRWNWWPAGRSGQD